VNSPSFYAEGYKNYNSLRRMINNRGGCVTPQQLSAQHGWVPRAWVRKGQIVPAQRKLFHMRIMNWDRLEPSTQTAITVSAWRWASNTDPSKTQ
jgi:hypothetical protein